MPDPDEDPPIMALHRSGELRELRELTDAEMSALRAEMSAFAARRAANAELKARRPLTPYQVARIAAKFRAGLLVALDGRAPTPDGSAWERLATRAGADLGRRVRAEAGMEPPTFGPDRRIEITGGLSSEDHIRRSRDEE